MLNFLEQKFFDSIYFLFGEIDFSIFSTTEVIIDILLVTIIIYIIFRSIVKIHAIQVMVTTLIFGTLFFISQNFNLVASKIILQGLLLLLIISIPLMFQQEIRQLFEKIGHSPFIFFKRRKHSARHKLIKAIKQAVNILAEKRHGSIIAIEKTSPLLIYAETGVMLNADLTKELLLNIFFPKSPLHDGAVIIKKNYIISAGAVLPFTHSAQDYIYGTRHKAALGLSEMTDAVVIITSEERGVFSVAQNGEFLPKDKIADLEKYLEDNL